MENKTLRTLLAIALGGMVVWVVFKVKGAQAEEAIPKKVVPTLLPEPKPKWRTELSPEGLVVSYDSYILRLPLFSTKPQDQLFKEAKEAEIARSLGL